MGRSIGETRVKHAIVVSAADSLPLGIKLLYSLKHKAVKLPAGSPFLTWKQFISGGKSVALPTIRKNPEEMAIISHTGGTTGEPKGVICSDKNINALIWQVGHVLPSERQDRMLVVLPPFVNYSLVNGMLEPLSLGHEVILLPAYKPEDFADYIRKYHPNHANTIPAYMEAVLSIEKLKKMDLSCLKYVYYGGEGMSAEAEEAVNRLLLSRGAQYPMGKGLGSTEMVSSATLTLPSHNVAGSVGTPFPRVRCLVCNPDTMQECSYNEEGEICFSGETVMLGYYHNQQATDDIIRIHADGQKWLHTGDIGYINEDGVIYVTGRIKRIIMTKGADGQVTKMFPDRIEKAICMHPKIELCRVVGVPDERRIHYPKAYVVLKPGAEATEQLTREIQAHCREKLPEYMVPEEIEYRAELPRTERGKVDYRALEKEAEDTHHA